MPALSLPWIVAGVGFTLKKRNLRSLAGLLLLVGFVFPIVFYSLSKSKLILYVLPCFPFLALFCAEHLQRIRPGLLRAIKVTGLGLGALLLAGMPAYAFSVWEISAVLAIVCMLSILALLAVWFATDVESGSVAVPAASMILVAGAVCWLIGANEEEVPTTDVVTDWMEQNDLAGRQILIYDKLMPSAAFHSEAPVALIADESENALRELQFEEDESWKEHYFNMNEPAGEARLMEEIASTPSVVVVRRKHAYEAGAGPAFLQHFPHAEDVGEYWVYY